LSEVCSTRKERALSPTPPHPPPGARVPVTGGAGYIGSHACLALLEAGARVVSLDNYSNSTPEALRRVRALAEESCAARGAPPPSLDVVEGDLCDLPALRAALRAHPVSAAVHFAGLKAVGESCAQPLRYYHNNVTGTLTLLRALDEAGARRLVFSSSATVYGDPERLPIAEEAPLRATNPYGQTKLTVEDLLRDLARADARWVITLLRYFNPVGAHPSGLLGEDPAGPPNNLAPYITQVAAGRRARLQVFGGDYPTPDGTGVRDYIHVLDLVEGHLAALARGAGGGEARAYNLGAGRGVSVLELVAAFEHASGRAVPYEVVGRRAGDVAACYSDAARALRELGWRATRGVDEMARDAWRWQAQNPHGYRSAQEALS